ncbi:MAG TPA: hypothetical protein VK974_07515 [Methylophilaceae bacterium]|nr:hypothetical protein [Methylophilaceae bacterium]
MNSVYSPKFQQLKVEPILFSADLFRKASVSLFVLLAIFIALTFRQHGISNDEEVQHIYGRLLLQFYSSGFADQSAFQYKNLYLYGGFFDLVAAGLEKVVPIWVWDMRHLLSAMFGFAGIVAAYKIARVLGGERAGFITVVLLAITGAWSGAMFTHTKDVPFATCMTWALYYTMLIAQRLPKPSLSLSIKLGLAVGGALGLRIGGVFAVIYLCIMIVIAAWHYSGNVRSGLQFCLQSAISLVPAALVAFALMALFWPWGVMSPSHPLEAAHAFSHFAFNMLTIMDGEVVSIGNVSRTYLLEYLLVRLPEIVLLGFASLIVLGIANFNQLKPGNVSPERLPVLLAWLSVIVATLFPLAFVLWDDPALYNGVRHFTFVIPPIIVLAALGLHFSWSALQAYRKTRLGFIFLNVVLIAITCVTLVRLHPYEYIYYNHFAGNIVEAEKDWEADYWSSSLREASDILEAKISENQEVKHVGPYLVAVCAESIQGAAYLDKRFMVTKDWVAADFYIATTNMHCDQVLQGEVIGTIKRMDATLAVIKDRRKLTGLERRPMPAPAKS